MKLKISGTEYDLEMGFKKATLQTLYVLNKDYGVSVKDLEDAGAKFEGKGMVEILSDPELMHALMAMIWMARRYAGEEVTLDESSSFPLVELELSDGDEPEVVAPKEQTVSDPDDDLPRVDVSSKTSKPRSTKTSRT